MKDNDIRFATLFELLDVIHADLGILMLGMARLHEGELRKQLLERADQIYKSVTKEQSAA